MSNNLGKDEKLFMTKTCRKCNINLTQENCCPSSYCRSDNICKICQNNYNKEWRKANRDRSRNNSRRSHVKLREEVLAAYGSHCSCCGENIPEFLVLDHVLGGGTKHRRELKTRGNYGILLDIKRQGFPKDTFQILCANCNAAKTYYGECPHTKINLVTVIQKNTKL